VASLLHEVLIDLVRRNPFILVDLIGDQVDGHLDGDDFHFDNDDSAFSRAPIHSDLTLVVRGPSKEARAVFIIEPQLHTDDRKYRSWPSYQADGHRRFGCPCYLIVITLDPKVAAWAAGPICTGQTVLRPIVLGPSAAPILDDDEAADLEHGSVELLLLFGLVHHDDDPAAERIGTALKTALDRAGVQCEHGALYWDLFLDTINEGTRRLLMLKFENYVPKSDWGKKLYAEGLDDGLRKGLTEGRRKGLTEGRRKGLTEGLTEGRTEGLTEGRREGLTEGRRETLLLLLEARGLRPSDEQLETITTCADASQLERWIRRAATATAPDVVFDTSRPSPADT